MNSSNIIFGNFSSSMYSSINDEFNRTCVLNQYALIETAKKLPIIALYLSIAIVVILGVNWIVLPFFNGWKHYDLWREALPGMAFAVSIWLPLILMYFTLDLNELGFKNLENVLLGICIVVVISVAIYYRRRIISWFQSVKKYSE